MAQWVSHSHASTLDEMIRLEGRGFYIKSFCVECGESQPTLCYDDCFGGELFCEGCIITLYVCNPLHNIKAFSFFLLNFDHQCLLGTTALAWFIF